MNNPRTIQTAFRFPPEMVRRMKQKARAGGTSVNVYVENLIEADLNTGRGKFESEIETLKGLTADGGISSEVLDFAQRVRLSFSKEEISADPRLKYLIER